jgi:hypothetical protein
LPRSQLNALQRARRRCRGVRLGRASGLHCSPARADPRVAGQSWWSWCRRPGLCVGRKMAPPRYKIISANGNSVTVVTRRTTGGSESVLSCGIDRRCCSPASLGRPEGRVMNSFQWGTPGTQGKAITWPSRQAKPLIRFHCFDPISATFAVPFEGAAHRASGRRNGVMWRAGLAEDVDRPHEQSHFVVECASQADDGGGDGQRRLSEKRTTFKPARPERRTHIPRRARSG